MVRYAIAQLPELILGHFEEVSDGPGRSTTASHGLFLGCSRVGVVLNLHGYSHAPKVWFSTRISPKLTLSTLRKLNPLNISIL